MSKALCLLLAMLAELLPTYGQLPRCSKIGITASSAVTPGGRVVCQQNKAQGTPLTAQTVAQLAHDVGGFQCNALVSAIAVVKAESGYDPNLEDYNVTQNGGIRSTDRGLWQLNTVVWPACALVDSCALDQARSTKYAALLYKLNGNTFNFWLATGGSNYTNALQEAQIAAQPYNSNCGPPCVAGLCPGLPGLPGGHGEQIVTSGDPNDKQGSLGVGSDHYLSGTQPISYAIFFDNVASATAPAQKVVVTDQLNTSLIDLSTVSLGPIGFAAMSIPPPVGPLAAIGNFHTDIDLRPGNNLVLRISAALDQATGVLTWTYLSLDPSTLTPTTDPSAGFLAPGAEGSVSFTALPKTSPTGTHISNKASVVFDLNPSLDTPTWVNTIDKTAPSSRVSMLAASIAVSTFPVAWTGSDVGAGVRDYTIFVSDNGAAYTPWLVDSTATAATYSGQYGHTYQFYSIARDLVGNVEPVKTAAEASTQLALIATTTTVTSSTPNANLGAPVIFSAVVSGASGVPTGLVTFLEGATSLGTGTLNAAGPTSSTATLSVSTMAAGSHTITASYGGAGAYSGSTSSAILETVIAPALLTSLSPSSINVARGSTGTSTLTLTPIGGYGGAVTLSCGTLPPHLSCVFAQPSITFNGANIAQSSVLTIGTTASAELVVLRPARPSTSIPGIIASALVLAPYLGSGWILAFRRRRGDRWSVRSLVILGILSGFASSNLSGCGRSDNKAAPGTYTVPINITANGSVSAINLTVVVQ